MHLKAEFEDCRTESLEPMFAIFFPVKCLHTCRHVKVLKSTNNVSYCFRKIFNQNAFLSRFARVQLAVVASSMNSLLQIEPFKLSCLFFKIFLFYEM